MRIEGKRLKRTRLLQGGRYVVAVDVEIVVPTEDPSEPCYESETVNFIRDVVQHANQGDLNWLCEHGKVYELIETNS